MTSTRLSLIVMLLASVNGARNVNAVQPCGVVHASSEVVPLGSPVSATCATSENCPIPIAPDVPIEWQLDRAVLPSDSVVNQSGRISHVFIPSFNNTKAFLECFIQTSSPQLVGLVQIRAGYLPSVPQHLHCQTNLTTPSTMLCSWDPGRDSHLLTNYSLHTKRSRFRASSYNVPPGHHHYTIPRGGFSWFHDIEIYVKAVNELGETNSEPVILEPFSAAKFQPPQILNIQALPKKYGCLRILWEMSLEPWVKVPMNVEVHLVASNREQRRDQHNFVKRAQPSKPIDYCRLLHGTRYTAQIRVRYEQSPWSEWSRSGSGVTLERAPTGRLDSWMKVSGDHMHKQVSVHLFWKPSKQFCANGQNVSYIVSRTRQPGERGQLCATAGRYCTFQAPARANVFLSAVNAAGRSEARELRIYNNNDFTTVTEMTVTPYDDTSLLVQWTSGDFNSLIGFVVEWRLLLDSDPANVQFQFTNKTQTSFVISDGIEPYKPYGISVYPRFRNGIGLPKTVDAYSRQKAPSKVPLPRTEKYWDLSVALIWDEIPLDQRNGFIKDYKVYYWDEYGSENVVHAKPDQRSISLKNLNLRTVYKAILMVSTFGGSRNSSEIIIQAESYDMVTVVITVTCCMGLILSCIIIWLHYTSHHKRFKDHFCPPIPDPANSSIKKWSMESLEEILPDFSSKEPSLVYVSHLSFLDLPAKVQKEDNDLWLNIAEDTSDLGESICGSPTTPDYCGSNSDSVPYATVIFSTSPSTNTVPRANPTYLRSESTQPLLEETEEAFTPKCYQNITAENANSKQHFFGSRGNDDIEEVPEPVIVWDEFPFLRALAMNDSENE